MERFSEKTPEEENARIMRTLVNLAKQVDDPEKMAAKSAIRKKLLKRVGKVAIALEIQQPGGGIQPPGKVGGDNNGANDMITAENNVENNHDHTERNGNEKHIQSEPLVIE